MSGSVFDYDAIGRRLKEIRPQPYLQPQKPLPPVTVEPEVHIGVCSWCVKNGSKCDGSCIC
jgi:hypothetical protein